MACDPRSPHLRPYFASPVCLPADSPGDIYHSIAQPQQVTLDPLQRSTACPAHTAESWVPVKQELWIHIVPVSSWVPAMRSVQDTYGKDTALGRVCSPFRPFCRVTLRNWGAAPHATNSCLRLGTCLPLQFVRETYGTEAKLQGQAVDWLKQQGLREFQREYAEELAAAAVQLGEAEVRASGAELC